MKNLKLTFISFCFSLFLFSCNGNHTNSPDDVMSAQIGTTAFASHGNDVHGLIDTNPIDNTKTELSITAESGSEVLTVAVFDYKNATGTFDFSTGAAIGGYNSGSGSDDPIVSGTLVITTAAEHQISGTFSGTTQAGTSVTNGSFTLNK